MLYVLTKPVLDLPEGCIFHPLDRRDGISRETIYVTNYDSRYGLEFWIQESVIKSSTYFEPLSDQEGFITMKMDREEELLKYSDFEKGVNNG